MRDYSVIAITFAVAILMFFIGQFLKKYSKTFKNLVVALGLSSFVFGFSYISGYYFFAWGGFIITFILGVLIILYLFLSDLKINFKKWKKKGKKKKGKKK